jgi:exosortase
VLVGPTIYSVGRQVWSRESGAHGPIILGVAIWLLWRGLSEEKGERGRSSVLALLLIPTLLIYVFGRAYDFVTVEAAGLFAVVIASLYGYFGFAPLLRNWFPILYLGFSVPPPGWALDGITGPLKQFVSHASTATLAAFGIPVQREGVTIYVAQYQLLVEDACSGMNSLIGLIAVSLLYIYLMRRTTVRYALVLMALVIPIAILVNIARIMILILLTYFYGDHVAQGYLHQTAGIVLFALDLVLVFAFDVVLSRVLPRSWRTA